MRPPIFFTTLTVITHLFALALAAITDRDDGRTSSNTANPNS